MNDEYSGPGRLTIRSQEVLRSTSTGVWYVSMCNLCGDHESKVFCITHRTHLCIDCLRSHLWSSAMTKDCCFSTPEINPEIFRWRRV
jgi:hypothetical protein